MEYEMLIMLESGNIHFHFLDSRATVVAVIVVGVVVVSM